jgi:hypothetical protein
LRNPGGQITVFDDSGERQRDTFTCYHCQRVIFVQPRQDPATLGAVCKGCMRLVCAICADARDRGDPCTPWLRQMEIQEERAISRKSLEI